MNSVDNSKRFTLSALGSAALVFTSGGILIPKRAQADPIITAAVIAILPSMISAIHSLFTANKDRAESNAIEREKIAAQERMAHANLVDGRVRFMMTRADDLATRNDATRKSQMEMIAQWLGAGVTKGAENGGITYLAATEAYKNTLATLGLSENFDGKGTYLGVKDGALYSGRRNYQGTQHAGEAKLNSIAFQNTGTMPVAVGYSQELDTYQNNSAIRSLADTLQMSDTAFAREYALISKRSFSSATNPTAARPDVSIYAVANKTAYERGQRVIPYEFMATS
jgi:hypothetical protein